MVVNYLQDNAPLSYFLVGLGAAVVVALVYFIFAMGSGVKSRARFNDRFTTRHVGVSPTAKYFERARIYLNDLVVPSYRMIEDRTFVDCEIVGPANIYLLENNRISEVRHPKMDAVFLEPGRTFYYGIGFRNCIFRNCSFHMITLFVNRIDYPDMRDHALLNWVTITPDSLRNPQISDLAPACTLLHPTPELCYPNNIVT